jgi:iron complex outermembrane receptor protein
MGYQTFVAGVSLLALCVAGQASAQQTAPPPDEAAPSEVSQAGAREGGLQREVITVTATRREESLQEVPLAITAVSGDSLQDLGVQSFADLARLAPGVVQSGSAQFSKFTVRGIQTSNTTSSSGEQKTVAVYLDDVPLTSFSILTPEISPYDMSRIEVLRGPQGTLFGSGSLAGAVRYITNKPDAGGFDASVEADVGVTDSDSYRRRLAGMINIPLAEEGAAVRVVAYDRDEDGYVRNSLRQVNHPDWAKAQGVRVSVLLEPTDALKLTGMYTNDRNDLGDISRYTARLGVNVANGRIPYTVDLDVETYNLTAEYEMDWATLISSTSMANVTNAWNIDLNAITAAPVYYHERMSGDTFTEDLRLVSAGDGPLQYVVGAFYLNQKTDYFGYNSTDPAFAAARNITGFGVENELTAVTLKNDRVRKNMEAAVYGELSWRITDELKATVGLRQSSFQFDDIDTGRGYDGQASYIAAVNAGGNRAIVRRAATASESSTGEQKKLTSKFNISWQPTPEQNYYFLASEGFRRGHPNFTALLNGGKSSVDPNDPTVIPVTAEPDTLWNYEIGAKTMWFDGKLQANAAVFHIPWENMQVNLVRPSDVQPFVGNAGKSTSTGVELELNAELFDALQLGSTITVQKAEIETLSAQEALFSGALEGAGLASPDFQIFAYAQQNFYLGDETDMFARVDVQHVGSYPNAFPNTPGANRPNVNYFTNPSYTNVNTSVGWSKGRVRIIGYVENLLDNDEPININASGSSTNRYLTLRPRTIGVRTSLKY